jgi:eukaryotic-like serine/threonine-protein kinase
MNQNELRAKNRVGSCVRGKWVLDKLLGFGAMGAVYAATHRNGNRVAIKMMHLDLLKDKQACERFLREGYVANRVEHPGVVRVLDDDMAEDGALFLVMELLEGKSVEDIREAYGGTVGVEAALSVVHELLNILAAAHSKLFDFGVARWRDLAHTSRSTLEGMALGTPMFMAPEQAMGIQDELDELCDIYAVGAVLFTLLTGKWVHGSSSMTVMLRRAAVSPAPSLATVMANAPQGLCHLVDTALAYEKKARWTNAMVMRNELAEVYRDVVQKPMLKSSEFGSLLHRMPSVMPECNDGFASLAEEASVDQERTTLPGSLMRRVRSGQPRRLGNDVLIALAAIGWADGFLDDDKVQAIMHTAFEAGLTPAEVSDLERTIKNKIELSELDLSAMTKEDRLFVYAVAIWLVRLDGYVHELEVQALNSLGNMLKLPDGPRRHAETIAKEIAELPTGDRPFKYDLARLRLLIEERMEHARRLRQIQS